MRIIDDRGREATIELGVIVLEEARRYWLEPPSGFEVRDCRLGPVSLTRTDGAAFELPIGHAVGASELVLECATATLRHRVELRPRAEKLDADAWCVLVDDLASWLPGVLVGLSEAAGGSAAPEGIPAGLVAAAVAPLVPELLAALDAVIRAPRMTELRRTEDRRRHAIRRVGSDTIRWLGRHPAATVATLADAESVPSTDPWLPARITELSDDHPANRAVRWYAERVAAMVRPVALALRTAAGGQFDTIGQWCAAQAGVLDEAAERIDLLIARSFLARLPAEPPGPSALLTLADEPSYARVLRFARRILGAKFSHEAGEGVLPVPARASFELYELWSLHAVQRALDSVLGEGLWRCGALRSHALLAHDLHELTLRRAFPEGELSIGYNLTFRNYLVAPDADRLALTGERRPDLVVAWRTTFGDGSWVVLDAKYRAAVRSVSEAFESLHIYRDGLRWRGFGGAPRAGLLLVPSVSAECAPWADARFRSANGLGLWALRPGAGDDLALGVWLLETLQL